MAKSWTCELCGKMISELAAYCKRTSTAYRHMACHSESVMAAGVAEGRRQVLDEQAAATKAERERREALEREQRERAEQERREALERDHARLRYYVQSLPRCVGCGRPVNTRIPHRAFNTPDEIKAVLGSYDVMEPSEGPLSRPNACKSCVEVERVQRNEARAAPKPPEPTKEAKPEVKDQPKPDRFNLIEIE